MTKKYNHLSLHERQMLFKWYHYDKNSMREIARRLMRSHSTISREIKRNMYNYYIPTYYPNPAQTMYESRIRNRCKPILLKSKKTQNYVKSKIKIGWTPQIISGRLKLEGKLKYVCHESIYQFIYKESKELIEYLPRKHKKRRKKYPTRKYKSKIPNKISILDRPYEIDDRSTPGHWESDSIESKGHKGGLNVIKERKLRLVKITKIKTKKGIDTKNAIVSKLSKFPSDFVKSITYDNGTENSKHEVTNSELECVSYFCQPYHSWEKGAVEQVNGLIRRYIPKGTDIQKINQRTIDKIEKLINNRPRKCLNYKTPLEVYTELYGALIT
jgi:IS30 family transposase